MEGKKRYVAIVLFLLIGLTLFTFANPVEEEKGSKGNGSKDPEVTDKDTVDGTLGTDEEQNQVQPQVQNQVADNSYANALAAVVKAEGSLETLDVEAARDLINRVTNQNQKDELTERLDVVEEAIDAIELVETLEKMVEEATDRDGILDSIDYRTDEEIIQKVDALRNEDVQESLKDRLQILSRILDDNTAPEYDGVEDNEITNKDVSLTYSDTDEETGTENEVTVKVTLDGEEIDYAETFTKEGTYVVTLTDEAFNETTVTFTIDKTAPKFVGIKNGNHYETIKVEVDDENATIVVKNMDKNETTEVANGTELTEDATYYITATDEAGNETSIWVAIDTTAPTITGVDETKPTNKNEIVYVKDKFLTSVTIDGKEYTRADFEVGANNENFSFQKKVTHEGTHTVVAKDKYGNTTTKTFVIDKTHNRVTFTSVKTSNNVVEGNTYYVKNGDTVTLRIGFREKLGSDAIVKIGGREAKLAYVKYFAQPDHHEYTATLTIPAEEAELTEGVLSFTIENVTDVAGNEGFYYQTNGKTVLQTITKTVTTNGKTVIYDRTAPERVYSTLRVNKTEYNENGTKYYYVKNGDSFEFAISFNERLAETPVVTIGGRTVEMKLNEKVLANENKVLYEGTFAIDDNEKELKEGTLEIKVSNVKDIVGNEATSKTVTEQTKTSNGRTVVYDRTAPTRKSADFYVSGLTQVEKTFYTQYGKKVVVNITTDEQLSTVPTFTLNNNGNSYPMTDAIYRGLNDKGYHLYQASFVVTEESGMTDGEITFTVSNIIDRAGNTRDDVTEPTNGRKVVLDNVAPKAKNVAILGGTLVKEDNFTHYANNGDIIYVNVQFYEKLAVKPTITLNDKVQTKIGTIKYDETSKVWIYSSSYKLTEGDGLENGEIQVKVSGYADYAGNVGATLTNDNMLLNSQKHVVIDRTNPTLTVKEESVGTDPYYSEISFKLYDNLKIDYFTINGTKFDRANAQWSDANYQNIKSALVEGENTIVLYDIAGNKTTKTFYMDWTKATINLAGTEGLNKNEMRVESGTEVTLDDVLATVTDNFDETTKIKPYKADLLISNVASENTYNYDFTNGFNTRHIGRYNIYYEYTDKAGNKSTATMLLVMTDTTPATITLPENGQAGKNKNEMHVESGTEVTLDDVLATVTDNVDETVKIKPYKADLLIGTASENTYNYDFTNGFDTRHVGRYNIYYTYTDKAGHVTNKTMLLVMTDTTAPTILIPGTAGRNHNEYIVEAGTHVTVEEIMATVTDNVDATTKIKPYKADLLISNVASENTYNYDFTNGFDTNYSSGRYNLYYEYTDKAGHTTKAGMMIVIKDTTAPTLRFTKAGSSLAVDEISPIEINGVYYFNQDVRVTISDKINLRLHGVDTYYDDENPARTGWLTDVRTAGEHTVVGVDAAGNRTEFTFVLTKNTATTENNTVTVTEDMFLIDTPFYNEIDTENEVTINGNGKTVTQYITSVDKMQWKGNHTTPNGLNIPLLANVFSSKAGQKVTIHNLTLTGTMNSVMFGNYEDASSNWFNTELNNVNITNVKVVSLSGGIAPAAVVYGKATLNNVNIYGTTRSELENSPSDPYWPIYDLAAVNSSNTTINGGKIGSIYLWAKAVMTISNAEVDVIDTLTTTGHLEIANGTTVNRINMNGNNTYKPDVTIKAGATVKTLDLTKVTNITDIVIEDGATVETIITADGEMTLSAWKTANGK